MVGTMAEGGRQGRLFTPATGGLRGTVCVPGDKSVSHRALLLGAVNDGPVTVKGFLRSTDTSATVAAVRALGVEVDEQPEGLVVRGRGWEGLSEPDDVIDVVNSGTLIRLLPGLVASLPFMCVLTGDASIRNRPMARIVEPLAAMGASVVGRRDGTLPPLAIRGGALQGMTHHMAVASAQVKSCVLLAGLRATGETVVIEPAPSRDHTERLLRHAGVHVEREGPVDGPGQVRVRPVEKLHMDALSVPGDFSSAAFFLVAALLTPGSEVTVPNAGLNPSRTGLLTVLRRMGADLDSESSGTAGPEPEGRITARTSALVATDIGASEVPNLIDELPLFLLAAARAEGTSHLSGAAELRAKECDRLQAMAAVLRALGVDATERPDGMAVVGDPGGWRGGAICACADHRVAMVGAIAGAASREGVMVDDVDCVSVSYPGFPDALAALGGLSTLEAHGRSAGRAGR
ncbi:MAG: 3-phosphoshikimate 1-carboxyvinyltransferase [bacterium]